MNSFQKNKYTVIKNAISYELANFGYNYFHMKRDAVKFLYQKNWCPQNNLLGKWDGDPLAPNTYHVYADFFMETLLMKLLPIMEKTTGYELVPTYSYARIYETGADLKRHKDRPSCEMSTTMNLGGDLWPIYLEPNPDKGVYKEEGYFSENTAGVKVELSPGDMLIYHGCELEHWREPFTGKECGQVFLHYNRNNKEDNNLFDGRAMLGLPK
jgi:hypothetical protein